MTDDDPTIKDLQDEMNNLQQQMDELNAELEEVLKASREVLSISKACEHMASKLAEKFNEPLADWWWI